MAAAGFDCAAATDCSKVAPNSTTADQNKTIIGRILFDIGFPLPLALIESPLNRNTIIRQPDNKLHG
jgi:hypothetical protein